MKYKKVKTPEQMELQYKRLLVQAFPKLRFRGLVWNWYKVYKDEPFQNPKFLRIYNAWRSTAEKRQHPFFQ